jgi:hypothetical protein
LEISVLSGLAGALLLIIKQGQTENELLFFILMRIPLKITVFLPIININRKLSGIFYVYQNVRNKFVAGWQRSAGEAGGCKG